VHITAKAANRKQDTDLLWLWWNIHDKDFNTRKNDYLLKLKIGYFSNKNK